jgi:hypothetical protein
MKELELELQKLKEAIELKDPYLQIEAIGKFGVELITLSHELGHNFTNCVNGYLDELK